MGTVQQNEGQNQMFNAKETWQYERLCQKTSISLETGNQTLIRTFETGTVYYL